MNNDLARAVVLLSESAIACRRLAPSDAAAMTAAAAALQTIISAPVCHRAWTPSAKAAARAKATAWMLSRLENWPADQPPPTQSADLRDAARDGLGVPRNYIIRARPPEWPLRKGRPKTRR